MKRKHSPAVGPWHQDVQLLQNIWLLLINGTSKYNNKRAF